MTFLPSLSAAKTTPPSYVIPRTEDPVTIGRLQDEQNKRGKKRFECEKSHVIKKKEQA